MTYGISEQWSFPGTIHTFAGKDDGLVPPPGYHYCGEVVGKRCGTSKHGLKPMPLATQGYGDRPHLTGAAESRCWCKPEYVECQCPGNHGGSWGHGEVMISHDKQRRLTIFSTLSR